MSESEPKPTTGMTRFRGTITIEVEIEVSNELIAGVLTDEWRSHFYPLRTPAEVAHHLAYNAIRNTTSVSNLDGFADRPDADARVIREDWESDDWEPVK